MKQAQNFILFQVAWFVGVRAAAAGHVWIGLLAMGLVASVHLIVVQDRRRELTFLLAVGGCGLFVDTVLSVLGLFAYPSSEPRWSNWMVPPWIVGMWIGFATLPRFSLRWLVGRPRLAAVLGAVGGPLSFLGGMRLGAIAPGRDGVGTWVALAAEYALVTPSLLWLAPLDAATRANSSGRRIARSVCVGSGVLFLALAAITTGCAGMKKDEIESRLLAMSKNTIPRAAGIQRQTTRVELDGESLDVEFAWVRLAAISRRDDSQGPIVFVHGTPASLFNWSMLLSSVEGRRLSASNDLYLLDVIGHGISRSKATRYTFQTCADHVRAFLGLQDLRDVTLVGQSYGGEFAWRCALDAPERVARLVLIDSSGYRRPDDGWLPEEEKLRNWPGAQFGYLLNSRDRLKPALQLHFGVPLTRDQLEEMYFLCDNAENWRAMTHLCRDENGTRESDIPGITQPTLLVWGANDVAYGLESHGRRFERAIRGARLEVVHDAGHYPHEERPDAVARAIRTFVESTSGAR